MMSRRTLSLFLSIALLSANWATVNAQTQGNRYFSETGHNVKGDFLVFYDSNPDALILYGYPITEEFVSKDGLTVQYFQRARFEFHAELPEGTRVQLTALGTETYVSTGESSKNNSLACRAYPETGHTICFEFLEYFDQYGGVAQFGYPISGFEYHENKLVQYFEKARLEWQPWRLEGQRVVNADLGRVYFDQLGEDPGLIPPVRPLDNTTSSVIKINVRAFMWKATTLATDRQLVFVIVQDQNLLPVTNASCTSTVHWPDGRNETTSLATNASGIGVLPLSFATQPQGSQVYADVLCSYHGLKNSTSSSFRIWY
ncbi:MAG: hypothetical protein K8S20_02325 [Chloroflexi bacterium]|nr:hypothetical protein [Chloroflexota bacterium]